MNAVAASVLAGVFSLIVGIFGPLIAVNLNRATAVKLLTEAAEKTGEENKRLNMELAQARRWVLRLADAIYRFLPTMTVDTWHQKQLRDLADQARIEL